MSSTSASSSLLSSALIERATARTQEYLELIDANRSKTLCESDINGLIVPYLSSHIGKVRDVYICENFVIMVTTDRQSAFDRNLASIPFKGSVLNLTSQWWFQQTKHFVPNHVIGCPHPNVTVAKRCTPFPIEFVVRGYMTGSTSTSIWKNYSNGMRKYCGHSLPDGMIKNQRLPEILLTPTTKDEHDELISADEVIASGRMTSEDWQVCARYAEELFKYSQKKATEKGLILVDTKYEFGKDLSGTILLIDEIQTPDSSRYWVADTYEDRMSKGEEPENIDKEFLRKWYISQCDPYSIENLPEAPAELVNELSRRYIMIYELLTDKNFCFDTPQNNLTECLKNFLQGIK